MISIGEKGVYLMSRTNSYYFTRVSQPNGGPAQECKPRERDR